MKKVLLAVAASVFLLSGCVASIAYNVPFRETTTIDDATQVMEGMGAKEVARYTSYWIPFFGSQTSGVSTYEGLISAEMRKGKRLLHVVTKDHFFYSQTIGYVTVVE